MSVFPSEVLGRAEAILSSTDLNCAKNLLPALSVESASAALAAYASAPPSALPAIRAREATAFAEG